MKKIISLGLVLLILISISCVGCASVERGFKSFESDLNGGLDRVVTIYDQNGKAIKKYKGKIDIKDTEYGNKVLFDLNGKRVIVYNATVISEEN
jgi:uncharacterized lipoprotein YehR (DUF1307 family)